ncbi:MAP7 domain-containing protein 3 [Sapajus apella]|uniref:MAP7 domain-containing protein 3 n=1 Tax=Sapajus apella TaxID=9515 RepID=A0A6J3GP70_SAPAP|nr:MAP7 domain-containing protein 3 [Sapajus apella]
MADGSAAGAGGSTCLRELRPRMVAAAHQIAERQKQVVVNSISSHTPSIRATFKPVIDGSVLKNDEKQRLARERREKKKRQQDADKETQLLEKERKTNLRHKQQLEEKERKLRERKEKDERRRIAVEEKRHQKDEALKEKFTAILHQTLERRRLAKEYQQKRWSLGSSAMANSENTTANKQFSSTEKLEQGTSFALIRQMPSTSAGLKTSIAKKKTNKEKSLSLDRRNTKAHSSANTKQVEKKPGGVPKYVMQYVTISLPKCTSDELRAFMLRISAAKIPPQTKVEEVPSEEVETPPKSMDAPSPVDVEIISSRNIETIPKRNFYTDIISEESTDLSSVASLDMSSVMSTTESEMSMDTSSELSIEASSKVHLETFPKKSKTDQQTLDPVAKKHLSYGECYTRSFSPANVCTLPSPVSSKSQIQKNQLSSPLLKQSEQSADPSLFCKMPLQCAQSVQSESSADKNKKESQSGNKNTAGFMNDRETKKIFAKLRRIAHRIRSRQEEEKRQEEMKQRDLCDPCISSDRIIKKSNDVEKKEAELLEAEELLKPEDGQQQKETEEKKGWPDQEDQEAPLQEGDTKIEAQGEADKHKKEHDRIISQNLKGRLQRKKRIEEVTKRRRKTDVNASKVTETPCHDTYEGAEATSEESDTDSLNEMFPSGKDPSSRLKMSIKNIKKMPPKLVFLRDSNSQVCKEPKTYFNSDFKTFRPKSAKGTSTQAVISRPSTKGMTSRTTKTRKADETNTTNRSSPQTKSGFHDILPKPPDTWRR